MLSDKKYSGARALLYHSMTLEKAIDVLKSNQLLAKWENKVPGLGSLKGSCLTRNPHFLGGMPHQPGIIRLHLDQTIVRTHNRIVPLDAEIVFGETFGYKNRKPSRSSKHTTGFDFKEEFVLGTVNNIHQSTVALEIYLNLNHLSSANDLMKAKFICESFINDHVKQIPISLIVNQNVTERIQEAEQMWKEEYDEELEDEQESDNTKNIEKNEEQTTYRF